MTDQAIKNPIKKFDIWVTILLLLYYTEPLLPYPVQGIFKYLGYGLIVLLIVRSGQFQRLAYVGTRDILLLVLIGLCLVSYTWSAAPSYTLDEVDPLIRASIFGIYLATRYSIKEQMHLIAWTLGISSVICFVITLAIPSYGISYPGGEPAWEGIYSHKQYFGRFMLIGCITLLHIAFESRKHRWIAIAGVIFTIVLLVLSDSKSALILLLISFSLLPFSKFIKQNYKLQVSLFIATFLLFSSILVLILGNLETIVVDVLGKNMEFNGRLPVWTLSIEKGLERPWFGYGYAGFWTSDEALYVIQNTWAATKVAKGTRFHAHNGLIDIFLQLGFVGLFLCLVSFAIVLFRVIGLINSTKSTESFWMLHYLVVYFLANLSDVRTFLGGGTIWALYVSMSLSTIIWSNRIKREYARKKMELNAENQNLLGASKKVSY